MKSIAALTVFSLFSPSASADVNMLDASFRQTFIDAKVGGLNIERRYDSRSNFMGLFGFGWCSTFDSKLDTKNLNIIDCGKVSNTSPRYEDGMYVQRLSTKLTRFFDADSGALIALKASSGPLVAIENDSSPCGTRSRLPRAVALGEGLKKRPTTDVTIKLEFDPLHENVTSVLLPDRTRLSFEYSQARDLSVATNAWSNTYRFDYDRLHNLTAARYPDSTLELIEYESDRDRLLKFQGRDGCIETYEHTISTPPREKTQISTARLTCNGVAKRQAIFRFGFTRKTSGWILTSFNKGT